MDIGAVFLILALALLVGLFVSRPFLTGTPARSSPLKRSPDYEDSQRSRMLAEYDHYLTALQELDFDQALGKIPDGDYPQQRQGLLQSAADLLRGLDSASGAPHNHDVKPQDLTVLPAEDRIEAAIAARRAAVDPIEAAIAARRTAAHLQSADTLEAMIAARRRARQEKSNGFCPSCGKPVQKSDRFCPKCGKAL